MSGAESESHGGWKPQRAHSPDPLSITSLAITELAQALEVNNTLTSLDLSGQGLGHVEPSTLGLQCNTALRKLVLNGCNLHDQSVRVMVHALKKNKRPALSVLELCDNDITEV